jgi:capsular exopolysaccharide synthesis family protein
MRPRGGEVRPRGAGGPLGAPSIDPFRVVRRHAWLLVASVIVGTALGGLTWFVLDKVYPLYSAQVLFEIRPGLRESRSIGSDDILQDELVFRMARTETVFLTGRRVLEDAMKDPAIRETRWHEDFIHSDGTFSIPDAVDELEEDLSTALPRNTNLFGLVWSTHHASDVPIVLNAISRTYIKMRQDLDDSLYNRNLEVFRTELTNTSRQLDDLLVKIRSFIKDKGITTLQDPRYSQTAFALEKLLEQITNANSSRSLAGSAYEQTAAKLQGTIEPTSEDRLEAEEDPVVYRQLQGVLDIETSLRLLNEQYYAGHPLVRDMESRLRSSQLALEQKLDEIMKRNLQAKLKEFGDNIAKFTNVIVEMEGEILEKETLLRELAADQSEYLAMEDRREHLETQRDAEMQLVKEVQLMKLREDARRVREAQGALTPREKSFPEPKIVIPLGGFALFGLTLAFIFIRELTDHRIKSASDLVVIPGARVLGVIPDLDDDPTRSESADLVVRRHPASVLAESYRQATVPILKAMDHAGYQTLLLLSGLPGAGTTTAATNLAATSAAAGRSVLIVDANFRRPRLAASMGAQADGPGLGDLLHDAAMLDEAIQDAGNGIHIIHAGTPANRVFERLNNGQFDRLVAQLRDRYDLILFDAPPAVVAGDAMVLANKVDAAVLIVRANQEQRGLVGRMINQMSDAHCDLLGLMLNRPRGTAGGYFKKNYATMAEYAAHEAG